MTAKQYRFRDSHDGWSAVCSLLDLPALESLRDPVPALRLVASAGDDEIERFVRLVLDDPPSMRDFPDEDERALFAAAVFAALAQRERRRYRRMIRAESSPRWLRL